MTEKLKILEHHVVLIRKAGFGIKGREHISEETLIYAKNLNSLNALIDYPFADESSRQAYSTALETATIAVLDNDFEQIPDYKEAESTKRNFDLICFKCPNYEPEKDACKNDERAC